MTLIIGGPTSVAISTEKQRSTIIELNIIQLLKVHHYLAEHNATIKGYVCEKKLRVVMKSIMKACIFKHVLYFAFYYFIFHVCSVYIFV